MGNAPYQAIGSPLYAQRETMQHRHRSTAPSEQATRSVDVITATLAECLLNVNSFVCRPCAPIVFACAATLLAQRPAHMVAPNRATAVSCPCVNAVLQMMHKHTSRNGYFKSTGSMAKGNGYCATVSACAHKNEVPHA